ncbi:hypothetical protein AB9M10_06820 [Rhodococcus erythropolis]
MCSGSDEDTGRKNHGDIILEEFWIRLLAQLHQPRAVSEHPLERTRKPDREPRLADTSDTGERQ